MSLNRRGFTLAELMVALILTAVVSTAIYKILVVTQRSSTALAQRIDVQDNVRSTVYYLSTALRDLDATDGDIIALSSTSMRLRAMRWAGVLCDAPAVAGPDIVLPLRNDLILGSRGPDATLDSVLVFRDGDPGVRTDDRWLAAGVTGVGVGTCADGAAATTIGVVVNASSGGNDSLMIGVTSGAPIRGFQIEELSLYPLADGRWWMGQRAAARSGTWTTRQPVLGPYEASGINLTFYDANDVVTNTPADVASVAVVVRGESRGRAPQRYGYVDFMRDSLVTRVALRNNRRF